MIGSIVRYVGAQYPEMAGLEGRVHSVGTASDGSAVISARWCGRYGHYSDFDSRSIPAHSVKKLRRFSRGVLV